jgi:hypothetical protein
VSSEGLLGIKPMPTRSAPFVVSQCFFAGALQQAVAVCDHLCSVWLVAAQCAC